jgi:hypothetical protein
VSAAVAQAALMLYEHLARAENVPVRAAARWAGDPLPSVVWTSSPNATQAYVACGEVPLALGSEPAGPGKQRWPTDAAYLPARVPGAAHV